MSSEEPAHSARDDDDVTLSAGNSSSPNNNQIPSGIPHKVPPGFLPIFTPFKKYIFPTQPPLPSYSTQVPIRLVSNAGRSTDGQAVPLRTEQATKNKSCTDIIHTPTHRVTPNTDHETVKTLQPVTTQLQEHSEHPNNHQPTANNAKPITILKPGQPIPNNTKKSSIKKECHPKTTKIQEQSIPPGASKTNLKTLQFETTENQRPSFPPKNNKITSNKPPFLIPRLVRPPRNAYQDILTSPPFLVPRIQGPPHPFKTTNSLNTSSSANTRSQEQKTKIQNTKQPILNTSWPPLTRSQAYPGKSPKPTFSQVPANTYWPPITSSQGQPDKPPAFSQVTSNTLRPASTRSQKQLDKRPTYSQATLSTLWPPNTILLPRPVDPPGTNRPTLNTFRPRTSCSQEHEALDAPCHPPSHSRRLLAKSLTPCRPPTTRSQEQPINSPATNLPQTTRLQGRPVALPTYSQVTLNTRRFPTSRSREQPDELSTHGMVNLYTLWPSTNESQAQPIKPHTTFRPSSTHFEGRPFKLLTYSQVTLNPPRSSTSSSQEQPGELPPTRPVTQKSPQPPNYCSQAQPMKPPTNNRPPARRFRGQPVKPPPTSKVTPSNRRPSISSSQEHSAELPTTSQVTQAQPPNTSSQAQKLRIPNNNRKSRPAPKCLAGYLSDYDRLEFMPSVVKCDECGFSMPF